MTLRTHIGRSLMFSAAVLAIASPARAQTAEESQAQAANQDASAQEADGDVIIVTATKRASTLQDVPFSINAQTQEDIQRANAVTIEDISRNVAGLTVQNLGPGQSQVSVRGVSAGQIVRDQPGVKEQVGVYMDESVISLSLFTPDFDLFDLNRVETLRGPQGTLFGSGSVGGTVRYITNQPKLGRSEGLVEGNINTVADGGIGYSLKGAINVPLGETAALRAVGYGTHYAGFIDAIGPAGGKNVNDGRRLGGRVSVLWEPSTSVRITPRVVYQDIKTNGFNRQEDYNLYYNGYVDPSNDFGDRMQYLKLREEFRDKTLLADLTASVVVAPEIELTSVTSYINRDILVSRDASALTGSVYVSFAGADPAAAGGADLASNLRDTTKLKQWSQELRLASTGSDPLQWVFGGFYSHVDRKYAQRLPTPGSDFYGQIFLDVVAPGVDIADTRNGFPADSPYNADLPYIIKQAALFGEASYDLGQFKLTAGGRYYDFKEERDFISGGIFANGDTRIGDKTKSSGFSPRFIVSYEPNRNLTFNVQAAKGFRLGGINDPLNIPLCSVADQAIYGPFQSESYDDETLWNYEAGVKYQDRGINISAAVFHTAIRDLQVTVDAGSCSSRIVLNVDKAHSTGVEFEMSATPAKGLDLSLAGSFVSSKFDSTVDDPILADRSGIRDGNRLPSVPRFQMAATGSYGERLNSNSEWYASATYQHVSSRYTQPGDQEPGNHFFNFLYYDPSNGDYGNVTANYGSLKLPGYDIFNVSAGLKFDNDLSFTLYLNNVFDTNTTLSLDRERGGRARIGYAVGQPRTLGLTVRKGW